MYGCTHNILYLLTLNRERIYYNRKVKKCLKYIEINAITMYNNNNNIMKTVTHVNYKKLKWNILILFESNSI